MSATTTPPPIPRQSIGTTFVVSMSILGAIAILQVLAVMWRYADVFKEEIRQQASARTQPQAQSTPEETIRPAPPPANTPQMDRLRKEADRAYRVGDFETAQKLLDQLEKLAPGDPDIVYSKAMILEKSDQPAEAILLLEGLLQNPALPIENRPGISKKLDQLAQSLGDSGTSPAPKQGKTLSLDDAASGGMRNEIGIQPGSTLGIVDVRMKDAKRGVKTLGVSVKSLPNAEIVSDKVKILAYFCEQTADGELSLPDSKIISRWVSPPIDWLENEPEILELDYTLPKATDSSDGGPRKYAGYVVGLYYKGELQDFRSEPAALIKKFPVPLSDSQ